MALPDWAEYTLQAFSPGELQAGYKQAVPSRVRMPHRDRLQRVMIDTHIRGTGIPASTLKKFQEGMWKPGPRSLKKLRDFYVRHTYNELKASGAPVREARLYSRRPLEEARKIIRDYRRYVAGVAKHKGIDLAAAVWAFTQSTHNYGYWESYVRSQKYDADPEDLENYEDMLDEDTYEEGEYPEEE